MRFGLHCAGDRVVAATFARGVLRDHRTAPVISGDPLTSAVTLLTGLRKADSRRMDAPAVASFTFEVSEILRPDVTTPVHLIRVSPRTGQGSFDPFTLPWLAATGAAGPRILHVPGGHNARGQEIVSLDVAGLASLPTVSRTAPRFVVTAVGSLLNPAHELRVGSELQRQFPGANIEYSHQFHHTSFAVRERTAFLNLALRERAESIVTALSVAARGAYPAARLFVATNCGGSIPLTRLAATPIDALASLHATQAMGAAAVAGTTSGTLTFEVGGERRWCELANGIPSVVPALHSSTFGKLATPASNVRLGAGNVASAATDVSPHDSTAPEGVTFAAAGAARMPRVDWLMTLLQSRNEAEMLRSKEAAEARLHARLVSTGVPPEHVRTVESLVTATSYGNPEVIALRIRAIADEDRPIAREGVPA
ncbi:hypothetical protein [Leucobacter aridicollis]|uniref:hypothetical protein n=1 Tax=Leucobacter aridicollis TaxID=283878 RepID=UPI002169FC5D|nr:hypothetical protein [Leucobacter aridicollis]MCS3429130.1 hypothetical protein [Leucobacter aridicollis]